MRSMITGAAAIAVLAALAACDNGGRATASQTPTARAERHAPASSGLSEVAWAASKTRSAGEAAQAQFEKNGAALGAKSVDEYVSEAGAFIAHPPKGAEKLERPNGDVLIYDAASNRFAVATAEGSPRTLFKPREGAAYWADQKAKAGKPTQARAKARRTTDES